MSQIRQNYNSDNEDGVNRRINLELYASYNYLSMAYYFDRDDVALKGLYKFFKKMSDEKSKHAEKLMEFQNKRGGRIMLQTIGKPEKDEWGSGLDAMLVALNLEKVVNKSLLELHQVACKNKDGQMTNFLENEFLHEQVNSMKEIGDHITNLRRVGTGLGEYLFDKKSLE